MKDLDSLRAIARVRMAVLLAQHDVGGTATLWQIKRALMPGTAAWRRSWAHGRRPGDLVNQAGGAPAGSNGRRRSRVVRDQAS